MSDVKNLYKETECKSKHGHYRDHSSPGNRKCIYCDAYMRFTTRLDVESLTTQLEEILLGYSSHEYVRGFDAGKNWEGEDEPILRDVESLAEAVAEVLELIGIESETK